ncbi:C40 family peptidase [Winogradskyella sp. MIT101101]|uniref:C40 family peptidase n=1 Tax=Winogradskyella sp. MIT101101 TaxID=3098297 RepID=UPI0039997FB6
MRRLLPILLLVMIASSCKSKKNYSSKKRQTHTVKVNTNTKPSEEAETIANYAKKFNGTRYKYGGTTKRGMDCSGLIYTSFTDNNISVPRTTSDLKSFGDWIDLKEVNVGDLVFFATRKNSRKVNHVGIVTNVRTGNVEFIHASTSRGVMISSLAEKYWYFAFVQARRVL